jgi:prepilin-type N-terminal cleavage/methylation domain-containing protein
MNYKTKKSGFALIEVLVAVVILTSAALGIVTVASKSLAISQDNIKSYQASLAMQEAVEAVKLARLGSWSNITSLSVGTNFGMSWSGTNWTIGGTPSENSQGFTRTIILSDVYRDTVSDDIVTSGGTLDSGTKKITITNSFTSRGQTKTQTVEFYIFDIF